MISTGLLTYEGVKLLDKKRKDKAELERTNSIKEVFQPHLPVRLPCYDLAPVTDLTLNSSLSGHRL